VPVSLCPPQTPKDWVTLFLMVSIVTIVSMHDVVS